MGRLRQGDGGHEGQPLPEGARVAYALTGAPVGAMVGGAGAAVSATVGIGDDFVREVERLMKPGTSALFVLDNEGDLNVISA